MMEAEKISLTKSSSASSMKENTKNSGNNAATTRLRQIKDYFYLPDSGPIKRASSYTLDCNSSDGYECVEQEKVARKQIDDEKIHSSPNTCIPLYRRFFRQPLLKKLCAVIITFVFLVHLKRVLRPSMMQDFFRWMEVHPAKGVIAYTLLYPLHMLFLIPQSPLVLGAGFIFKTQYGWVTGVLLCSMISLFGSLLGSVMCFLLGRYWIRESVRQWSRKYPLFDAIDSAVSHNGFKVMCYLYLTPILPLAPTCYMMGTTSMPLKPFALSKIAALPNTIFHVYIGAAAGTLVISGSGDGIGKSEEASLSPTIMIVSIILSFMSVTFIGIKIKKELRKVLDEQKGQGNEKENGNIEDGIIDKEKGLSAPKKIRTRQRFSVQKSEHD